MAEGKGYFRVAGERLGTLGFTHWCGPKQYSWIEWLVPDDHPPVTVSMVDVRVNARHWVVEAQAVDVWPSHGDALKDYTFLGFTDKGVYMTANTGDASKPYKWVTLHEVDASSAAEAGQELAMPEATPPCKALRLRVLQAEGVSAPGTQLAASLSVKVRMRAWHGPRGSGWLAVCERDPGKGSLQVFCCRTWCIPSSTIHRERGALCGGPCVLAAQVHYPEGTYCIGGGKVSGSGGNAAMEDAGPANAFDGSDQTRWVDIDGGGIGNVATLLYEHAEPVEVCEYSVTTQGYALSSYHSHLNGAPRDWMLKARRPGTGGWVGGRMLWTRGLVDQSHTSASGLRPACPPA